jgi:methionine-S-sulfoxide reductase
MDKNIEVIYLGGGCFWCLEAVYQRVIGVTKVVSGYSGGNKPNPTYEEVCSGDTNHAEVVEVSFNSEKISLDKILDIFFEIHDPTTLNRQGGDIGTQYRSIVLFENFHQEEVVRNKIKELEESKKFSSPIITEVVKFEKFYKAEDYHQNFYNNNPNYPYCRIIIDPKIRKLIDIQKE